MDQALAKALNLESVMGALIFSVTPDGPADQAGLRRGDVVLQFAGEPVRNAKELQNLIALQPPGQAVPAVVWRDSVKIVCEITPEAWPTSAMAEPAPIPRNKVANKLGIQVRGLAAQVARQQNLRGVTISHLDPGGPAEHVLSTGDIIMEINRKTVNNVRDFQAALHQLQSGQTALLLVHRGEQTFFVGVEAL
jgi:serine protease Do